MLGGAAALASTMSLLLFVLFTVNVLVICSENLTSLGLPKKYGEETVHTVVPKTSDMSLIHRG